MEVALEPRLGGPAGEGDAALVGRLAGGHPLRFLDTQTVEESPQPGRGALSDTNGGDGWRLQHSDLDSTGNQGSRENERGHPTGGTSADDQDAAYGRRTGRGGGGAAVSSVGIVEEARRHGHRTSVDAHTADPGFAHDDVVVRNDQIRAAAPCQPSVTV